MLINVRYMAQVRHAAGISSESVDVSAVCTVRQLVCVIGERRDEPLRQLLLDGDGQPRPTILLFVDDRHIAAGEDVPLSDGNTVTLLSPISGG